MGSGTGFGKPVSEPGQKSGSSVWYGVHQHVIMFSVTLFFSNPPTNSISRYRSIKSHLQLQLQEKNEQL